MQSDQRPLIALINATPAAISPATDAFAQHFPEAQLWNLLDDRLQEDAGPSGVTTALADRMRRLINHAVMEGAQGVLLTCSLYASVAQDFAAESQIPVLAPDEVMFREVLTARPDRVLVLANANGPLQDTIARLKQQAQDEGISTEILGAVAEGAAHAAREGNLGELIQTLRAAVETSSTAPSVILLGQYSLSPASQALQDLTGIPVYSGPASAAASLHTSILGGQQ
jgi:Asp/Glu/hydantoin racemase